MVGEVFIAPVMFAAAIRSGSQLPHPDHPNYISVAHRRAIEHSGYYPQTREAPPRKRRYATTLHEGEEQAVPDVEDVIQGKRRRDDPAPSGAVRSFPIQQRSFALDAPGISGKSSVVTNDAVTRNSDGQVVRRTSASNRTNRLRQADPLRDLGIRDGGSDGNLLKSLPDTLLEGRAPYV